MARREALGAFQRRLADRLQVAPAASGDVRANWLAVEAGGRHCLLPLAQSGEIFPVEEVQGAPYTRAWFLGIANLRGVLHGVVDLAGFIGESHRDPPDPVTAAIPTPVGPSDLDARLIALAASLEVQAALRVERVTGLRGPDDFVSSTPPSAAGPGWFGGRHADPGGLHWQEIDLAALSRHPQFLLVGT